MKTKLLIYLFGMILLSSFVNATVYVLNDTMETAVTGHDANWARVGAVVRENVTVRSGSGAIRIDDNVPGYMTITANLSTNTTCSIWAQRNAKPTGNSRNGLTIQNDDEPYIVSYLVVSGVNWTAGRYSGTQINTSVPIVVGEWVRLTIESVGNRTTKYYINNTYVGSSAGNESMQKAWVGLIGGNTGTGKSYYDDFLCWNGTFVDEPINWSGPPPSAYTNLSINLTRPSNNISLGEINFTTFPYLNASFVPNFNVSYCEAYLTGLVFNSNISNLLANITYNMTFNMSLFTQGYNFGYVECTNVTGTKANSSQFFVWFDTTLPVISHDFVNNRFYWIEGYNISGQFNFSDETLLYSYNFSIDGTSLNYSAFLTGLTANYSLTISPHNYSLGNHTIKIKVSDGHTAQKISDYQVTTGLLNDYLQYSWNDLGKEKSVRITGDNFIDFFDTFDTEKQIDRYTFDYKPSVIEDTYSFDVEAEDPILIVENPLTHYKKWLIFGDKWLDFYLPEEPNAIVQFERLTDKRVRVVVNNVVNNPELQEYASFGELNIVTQYFNFSLFNASVSYPENSIEELVSVTNFTLIFNSSFTPTVNASLMYNLTLQNVTNVSITNFSSTIVAPRVYTTYNQNISLEWNATINGIMYNFTFYSKVYPLSLSDCLVDSSGAVILTFHSLSEESNTTTYVDDMDMNVDMDLMLNPTSHVNNVHFEFHDGNNYSICIQPNVTTLTADAIIEYSAPLMANRKYYLNDFSLNASTNNVYLYQLNSSKASDIVMSVYDKNTGLAVKDVYIKILRYYPNLNLYRTVEIEKTDENGQTLGKMVLADVFYKFMLDYNGNTVLDSVVQKILTTTKVFYITLTEDVLNSFRRIEDVDVSVSCSNSTNVCRFTWSDSTNLVRDVSFKVYRENGFGKTLIYNASASGAAGTLTYTITEDTNKSVFSAHGYIHTNTTNSLYEFVATLNKMRNTAKETFGKSALFPIMLLMISMMAALLDFGAIGVITGSIIILFLGMISGIFAITPMAIISVIIMGGVLIARLRL